MNVYIESAKSGSMDSSSLQSNIGFKIKDNYPSYYFYINQPVTNNFNTNKLYTLKYKLIQLIFKIFQVMFYGPL